jgi:hypothetical protein
MVVNTSDRGERYDPIVYKGQLETQAAIVDREKELKMVFDLKWQKCSFMNSVSSLSWLVVLSILASLTIFWIPLYYGVLAVVL